MKRVFCLGNGESRKDVNLSALNHTVRFMGVMLYIEISH